METDNSKRSVYRKKKRVHQEEHDNAERYLITYADLITLLLGLFVILYASSQVDAAKYNSVVSAFSEYFEDDGTNKKGGDKVLPGSQGIPAPILPTTQRKSIDEVNQEVEKKFKNMIQSGLMSMERTPTGLALRLPEMLLFNSGNAEVQPKGRILLDTLTKIFTGVRKVFIIEGHSDSIPMRKNFLYESNLHLSSARALNVGYYMIQRGLDKQLVSVRGYGDSRPLVSNVTEPGRAKNRRVEIIIEELPKNEPSDEGYVTDSLKR